MALCSSNGHGGMVVTEDGGVFVWGFLDALVPEDQDVHAPALSLPSTRPSRMSPHNWMDTGQPLAGAQKVVTGELGPYSGALVTEDGGLFCFGLGYFGGTGQGTTDSVLVPTRVRGGLQDEHVLVARVAVATSVLTKEGHVWTFGNNSKGQLGVGTFVDDVFGPQRVAGALSNVRVVHLSCGNIHTLAVASTGRVFSWGGNDTGQLGQGDVAPRSTPTPIEGAVAQERVVFTASSTFTNAAVTSTNRVWMWGYHACYQMGPIAASDVTLVEERCCVLTPAPLPKIKNMDNVTMMACHDEYTLALNTNQHGKGEVWVWGRCQDMGAWRDIPLGTGGWQPASKPKLIGGQLARHSAASVSCGRWHGAVLTEEGRVFTWGRGWLRDPMGFEEFGFAGHGEHHVLTPRLLADAHGAPLPPVGRLRPLSQDKALAFAMAAHARLGSGSLPRLLMPELIQKTVELAGCRGEELSDGVLRLLGAGYLRRARAPPPLPPPPTTASQPGPSDGEARAGPASASGGGEEEEGHRQARGEAAGLPRGVFERRVASCLLPAPPTPTAFTFPRTSAAETRRLARLLHSRRHCSAPYFSS